MKSKIYYTKPSITELEISYASDAAANGWGKKCYDYIHQFEEKLGNYLDVKHVIATSSCTGALHMGLAGLNIGSGDEVILADSNWVATASPILYLHASPVFVDIDPINWCIDPKQAEDAITSNTKVIIATHLYGNVCDMNSLLEIGRQKNVLIIEDAAEAIGSVCAGQRAGSIGKFGVFSFHGSKTITTGEGGAFVTNDTQLYEKVLTLSNHGRKLDQIKQFWPDEIGYKYKMANINAAIGCAQLERIEELVAKKRRILASYKNRILKLPGVSMNVESDGIINGAWMPTVVFSPELNISREDLLQAFTNENIDARVFFWPLSSLPIFGGEALCEKSKNIAATAINLPSYHDITDDDLDRVCTVLENISSAC